MILRCILLLVCTTVIFEVSGDTQVRQQRIVRRPQDFNGPRPGISSISSRGPPGGPRPNGPNIQKPVLPPSQSSNRPRVQIPAASNKKPVFRPQRPKTQPPLRVNEKPQPQVEYGFKPINVASNGYAVSNEANSQETSSTNNVKQQKTVTTVEIEKPLVINVQPIPPVASSFQNHNQNDNRVPISNNPHQNVQHIIQQNNKDQNNFEASKVQQNFEHFQNQNFAGNSKRNTDFSNNQHNTANFENENKNKPTSTSEVFNRGQINYKTEKVPVGASISFQNQQLSVAQSQRFQQNSAPQIHLPRGQFSESKIINTGAQFQVHDSKQNGPFLEDKNIPTNFGHTPQLSSNFGQAFRNGPQFNNQGNKFHGPGFANFNQEKPVVPNVNFQVTNSKIPQYFAPEIKVFPHIPQPQFNHAQFPQSQFHQQQPQFATSFNPDSKFINNNQFIVQESKINAAVPIENGPNIQQIQNQPLQGHYQIQGAYQPINLQTFPQFKIPPSSIPPQFLGQKLNIQSNPDQISIPVGATFPFGYNANPFVTKGIAQGQVFPVTHVGGGIPLFTPLPQSLQFPGVNPVDNVQQSLSKDQAEQDVAASQTTKLIAPPPNTSVVSPSKPKKTTLKDILAEDCSGAEEFGYCASPPRYPTQQVSTILKQCAQKLLDLYEPEPTPTHHITERANNEPWSWSTYENPDGTESTCESTAAIVEPGYARDAKGHWLVVLQQQASNLHQRVTVDVCAHEGGTCGCVQQYENKNLIAWDPDHPTQCPTLKQFKFPTKCICPGEKAGNQ